VNNQLVVCDICHHELGIVDLDTLSAPMLPEMFKSIDEKHGIAPPFQQWMEWDQFVCRQCKFRPFHKENEITIMNDRYITSVINIDKLQIEHKMRQGNQEEINKIFGEEIVEKQTPVSKFQEDIINMLKEKRESLYNKVVMKEFICGCGKVYQNKQSLVRHRKACNE